MWACQSHADSNDSNETESEAPAVNSSHCLTTWRGKFQTTFEGVKSGEKSDAQR